MGMGKVLLKITGRDEAGPGVNTFPKIFRDKRSLFSKTWNRIRKLQRFFDENSEGHIWPHLDGKITGRIEVRMFGYRI